MRDKCCVLQDDLKDCGVCCLLSVIKYYDGNVSKEYLRELTKTTRNGVNAINLLRSARELGFEAYGVKASLNEIKKNYLPIIAHITVDKKFNHFVVIYEIDTRSNQVLIMNPSKGFEKMTFTEFIKVSTNYYLVLKVKNVIPKITQDSKFLDNIKDIFIKYKWVLVIIVFMSIIFTIGNIISSYNFKLLYDEINLIENKSLIVVFVVLISLIFLKFIVHLLRNLLINKLNFIIDENIVTKAYNHIINLPYLYYKNHTNGDLLTRINDLGSIKELISNFFVGILVDLLLAFIVLVFMFKINVALTVVTLLSLGLFSLVTLICNKSISRNIRENLEDVGILNNYLVESLSSFETIKNLSIQKYISKQFYKYYHGFNKKRELLLKKVSIGDFFKNNIIFIGNLIVLYLGVNYIKNDSLSITLLITYISLSNYLIDPIRNLLNLSLTYQNTKEGIRRIKEIYNIPKENLLSDNKRSIKVLKGGINIQNVSYSYNGIDKIIDNISFEIMEGEKVLLFGKSGSGKSTLMELLIKYLDNNYEGNITVGGYDLKNIDIRALRENICYVSQNEFLYTNSVYENITLGRKIDYKRFLEICKNLYIDDIVKRSNLKYNYLIENNGENISGGERARIILARCMLSNANLYIFDESFASIDIHLEKEILKYLLGYLKDKTVIIISHRKSNIDMFDRVVMLGENSEEVRESV